MNKKVVVNKKDYAGVDAAKLFFCGCILFLHTGAYHDIPFGDYVQHSLLSLAVPFFFVTSGYFFGCKVWRQDGVSLWRKLIEYEKRLLYPYLVFTIINSLIAAIEMCSKGESFKWMLYHLVHSAIFYPYGALWYVWACMTGMFVLILFLKYNKLYTALVAGVLCYIIALLFNSYYFMLEGSSLQNIADIYLRIAQTTRNGIFMGFPLLGLGVLLAKYRNYLLGRKACLIGAAVFAVSAIILHGEIRFIEIKDVTHETALFLFQPVLVASLLVLLLNCKWEGRGNMIFARRLSVGIYFIHRPVLTCLKYILNFFGIEVSGIVLFGILLLLCIGICFPIYYYKKEPFYSIMK